MELLHSLENHTLHAAASPCLTVDGHKGIHCRLKFICYLTIPIKVDELLEDFVHGNLGPTYLNIFAADKTKIVIMLIRSSS